MGDMMASAKPYTIPLSLFGGDTEYPDDMGFLAYILDKEWTLGVNEHPGYIYHDERALARDNGPDGRGSIYIYDVGYPDGPLTSIDYESVKRTHNVSIDVLNKDKDRHMAWVREIVEILRYYRRAGQSKNLNGWDYLEIKNKKRKSGMINFYGTVIDLQFIKTVQPLQYSGFACISRKQYEKEKRKEQVK